MPAPKLYDYADDNEYVNVVGARDVLFKNYEAIGLDEASEAQRMVSHQLVAIHASLWKYLLDELGYL